MDNKFKENVFVREVGLKAARKLKAKKRHDQGIWFGMGMMGLIGWSVITPTLLGVALGIWLDKHYPASHSWTLTFLILGLILGCIHSWHWISGEGKTMKEEEENE